MTRTPHAHAMAPNASTGSRRVGVAIALIVTLSSASLLADAIAGTPAHAGRPQRRLLRMINDARRRHDARPLKMARRLTRLARRHSRQMARSRTLFHSSRRIGGTWGENVGYTYHRLRSIHRAFMRSRSHRRNILSRKFRRVGIGYDRSGRRLWVTEIFAD